MSNSNELAKGFLLLCDIDLEEEVSKFSTLIRTTSGKVILKTIEDVEDAKGATIDKKLENVLNVYAHGVIIVTSENFAKFIDKKEKSQCPEILKSKFKDCISVLKKFMEKEAKRIPHKLILVSLNGDTSVPKILQGMPVLTNDGDMKLLANKIIAQLIAKMNGSM